MLEIETPIEVEHFDPRFPLYCRTFQKLDVQKHWGFDEFLSIWVQKHKENVTFSKNEQKVVGKSICLMKLYHFHCTVVHFSENVQNVGGKSTLIRSQVRARAPGPRRATGPGPGPDWALGPARSQARAPGPSSRLPTDLGPWSRGPKLYIQTPDTPP